MIPRGYSWFWTALIALLAWKPLSFNEIFVIALNTTSFCNKTSCETESTRSTFHAGTTISSQGSEIVDHSSASSSSSHSTQTSTVPVVLLGSLDEPDTLLILFFIAIM